MQTLKLHKDIFDKQVIESAREAYRSIASIQINEDPSHWLCTFHDCAFDDEKTAREFENYVIDTMNAVRR